MSKRRLIGVGAALLVCILAGAWLFTGSEATASTPYRLAEVERGDLESAVSATGTLNAVTTVQVGTQVSGRVLELHADFNDRVRKGELIARIDPTLQQQSVREAEATLERNRADLARAQREFEWNRTLFEQRVITESEFNAIQYNLAVAQASVKTAQVSLDRARQNLAYTEIYAPIDGIVVERNVEPGQTVAASLSAPQLFLIANDLAEMQILASVDESDIGQIETGQTARFSVQAYPDESFEGVVRQVRLQSTNAENVVSYTAVISVENPEGKLLPGMTASVDFLVQRAADVLQVPNAALRFRPTEEMLAELGDSAPIAGGGARAAASANGQARQTGEGGGRAGAGAGAGARAGAARPALSTLWYVRDGKLGVARVRAGISDGTRTEISGPALEEGMEVIVGLNQVEESATPTNPFQQQPQAGAGPGGPGGFRPPGGF